MNLISRFILPAILGALLLPVTVLADGLTDIVQRKTVRIGVCDFAPWTFTNIAGQLDGFEIDNGNLLAHDLGVTAEFKLLTLDAAFSALESGEIDLVAAGLAITPARALRVEFSNSYFESGITLVTNRKLAPQVAKPADLNKSGFVVAVVADTFSADLAGQLFDVAQIKSYPDALAAEADVLEGKVHAFLTSLPDARILITAHPTLVAAPLPEPLVKSVAGFAVKRGNQAVLNFLNAWIAARRADGQLALSYGHWFSGYEWLPRMKTAESKR